MGNCDRLDDLLVIFHYKLKFTYCPGTYYKDDEGISPTTCRRPPATSQEVYTPPQKSGAPFRLCWRFLPITWRNSSETLLTFVET